MPKYYWEQFARTTSLNGIYFIYNSKSITRKVIWITIFAVSCTVLSFNFSMLLKRYMKKDVQTTQGLELAQTLPFPAVTVCNLSPVDKSKLTESRLIQALLMLEKENANRFLANDLESDQNCSCIAQENDLQKQENLTFCCFQEILRALNESETSTFSDLLNRMQLQWDDYVKGAHLVKDFILSCSYNGENCLKNLSHIDDYYSTRYGKCYIYGTLDNLQAERPGEKGTTLELILNINAENYIGLLSSTYGAKLTINDPNLQPLPDQEGITLSPGTSTLVAISRQEVNRLKAPYTTNCMDQYPTIVRPFLAEPHMDYSSVLCRKACRDFYTNLTCGCTENLDTPETAGQTCDPLFNERHWACVSSMTRTMTSSLDVDHGCGCEVACREVNYRKTVSTTVWPTETHKAVLGLRSKNAILKSLMFNKSIEWIRSNLLQVKIFYESFDIDRLDESPDYSLATFLSDVGGVTGLYLGMSFITLFELLECLISFMQNNFLERIFRRNKHLKSSNNRIVNGLSFVFRDNNKQPRNLSLKSFRTL